MASNTRWIAALAGGCVLLLVLGYFVSKGTGGPGGDEAVVEDSPASEGVEDADFGTASKAAVAEEKVVETETVALEEEAVVEPSEAAEADPERATIEAVSNE